MVVVIVAVILLLIIGKMCPSLLRGLVQLVRVVGLPIIFGVTGFGLLNVVGAVIGIILGLVLAIRSNRRRRNL